MASTTDQLPIAGPSAPITHPLPSQPSVTSHPLSTDIALAEPISGIDAVTSGEPNSTLNQDATNGGTTPPVPMVSVSLSNGAHGRC